MINNQTETIARNFVNIAYETFALKTSYLDILGNTNWRNSGIENWVQIELALGFTIRGYDVTTNGKQKRQCDLLVNNHGVELRCSTRPDVGLFRAVKQHPEADFYLFLSKIDQKMLEELQKTLNDNACDFEHRPLNDEWMVMVAWKRKA